MSIYVLSYEIHIHVMGTVSVLLFVWMYGHLYPRACLLIAWFYVLGNIGANGNSKYRQRPRINQVNK